jgi:hypothetical protein
MDTKMIPWDPFCGLRRTSPSPAPLASFHPRSNPPPCIHTNTGALEIPRPFQMEVDNRTSRKRQSSDVLGSAGGISPGVTGVVAPVKSHDGYACGAITSG